MIVYLLVYYSACESLLCYTCQYHHYQGLQNQLLG